MKRTLQFQVSAFVIYLLNHIGRFSFKLQSSSIQLKAAFGMFLLLSILAFLWDYQFNYRKRFEFIISPFLFLLYGISMWLFDGVYELAALNLVLLIAFYLFKRKLTIEEEAKYKLKGDDQH